MCPKVEDVRAEITGGLKKERKGLTAPGEWGGENSLSLHGTDKGERIIRTDVYNKVWIEFCVSDTETETLAFWGHEAD